MRGIQLGEDRRQRRIHAQLGGAHLSAQGLFLLTQCRPFRRGGAGALAPETLELLPQAGSLSLEARIGG